MKRLGVIFSALLVVIFLVLAFLIFFPAPSPTAPKFISVQVQPTGPYTYMDYDWGGAVPVRDGKVWFCAESSRTNVFVRQFLYDLDRHRVTGELLNAGPIFANRDQTKLLCEGYGPVASLKWRMVRWLEKYSIGKNLAQRISRDEVFWVLDLRTNKARKVGGVSQLSGMGSRFIPSPGFRYGYNKPSTSWSTPDVVLCDLESNLFTRIRIDGNLQGWWDEQSILFKDSLDNFKLFDVSTRKTSTLFTAEAISAALKQNSLPGDASAVGVICQWNGNGYDILLTQAKEKDWGESFLLKINRADRTFKLLYPKFKFQWAGYLDTDAGHYLYEGESGAPGKGGNGGVFIRDLAENTIHTLVPPDNGGQYSLARFGGDGVIYWRKKILWRIDLNGSNNAPLLP